VIWVAVAVVVAVAGAGCPVVAEKVAPALADAEVFLVFLPLPFLALAGWELLTTGRW
jgi:hypothetical protein